VYGIAAGKDQGLAAREAGYSDLSADAQATALLKITEITDAIAQRRKELANIAGVDENWILNRYIAIVKANPNDLTQIRRLACEKCWPWGVDETYTLLGFTIKRPRPDCEFCDGEGELHTFVADTRLANSPLYAGFKQTKDGLEIKKHDQLAALHKLAEFAGMNKSSVALEAVVRTGKLRAEDMTDEELAYTVRNGGTADGEVALSVADDGGKLPGATGEPV